MDPAIPGPKAVCTDMVVYEERAVALPSPARERSDPPQRLDVPGDATEVHIDTPLLAIESGVDDDGLPLPSAYTRAHDRLYQGPLLGDRVTYRECQKNQDPHGRGPSVDGCREYVPSRVEVSSALRCKTCGCHRSYHRVEIYKHVTPIRTYDPSTGVTVYFSQPPV